MHTLKKARSKVNLYGHVVTLTKEAHGHAFEVEGTNLLGWTAGTRRDALAEVERLLQPYVFPKETAS